MWAPKHRRFPHEYGLDSAEGQTSCGRGNGRVHLITLQNHLDEFQEGQILSFFNSEAPNTGKLQLTSRRGVES